MKGSAYSKNNGWYIVRTIYISCYNDNDYDI